ncbi:MAG: hypothetical protein JXA77_00370 [Bacteroidales bacterium]|nr:hypothetical protein [Bacteroidales bacterium]MBN2817627.1 hypothetical protein [Bacteroidales bacterium]
MNKSFSTIVFIFVSQFIFINLSGQSTIQAPEYTSFEPVDAANMVNLIDGDVTYNIPIMYVPSKSNGFPISLFYQAGIQVEQEASWVGLGWNINSGAINRFVNAFPDDWNEKYINRVSYIDGFVQESNSFNFKSFATGGASVGVSWGYSKSLYNYESFVNYSVGYDGASFSAGTNGFGIGFDFYEINGVSFSADIGYDTKNNKFSYGVSSTIDESGLGIGLSNEGTSVSCMGVSLSNTKSGVGFGTPIGGFNLLSNSLHSSNMRTRGSGFTIPIPIPWARSLITYSHMRYESYIYKTSTTNAFGILYSGNAILNFSNRDQVGLQKRDRAMDAYANPFNVEKYRDSKINENSNCLTHAAYDAYVVSSQGINGSISPFISGINNLNKEGVILKYRDSDERPFDEDEGLYYCNFPNTNNYGTSSMHFYFNGERTGYRNSGSPEIVLGSVTNLLMDGVSFEDYSNIHAKDGSYFNTLNNRHASDNFVKWFTNDQIRSGAANSYGFIDDESMILARTNSADEEYKKFFDPDGIGGFMITAIDGKTYYYSIPVYNFETFNITERTDKMEVFMDRQPSKYAYTWLLTAITGPDYIDINNNGLDDDDYGFWIKFNHGKWSDGYIWRNPYSGYNMNKDGIHGSYSIGRKQLYYLNSIESNTHIAYFIKSLRDDALGTSDFTKTVKRDKEYVFSPYHVDLIPCGITNYIWFEGEAVLTYTIPEKTKKLKLDKIVLLSKADGLNISPSLGEELVSSEGGDLYYSDLDNLSSNFVGINGGLDNLDPCIANRIKDKFGHSETRDFVQYYSDNVIDINDIETYGESVIRSKSLNTKEFSYNYSLCESSQSSGSSNKGKLTLTAVNNLSKGGMDLVPPTSFEYYIDGNNNYSSELADDWGFHKDLPWQWSLKSITNELGSEILIDYESDDYATEAVFNGIVEELNPDNFSTHLSNDIIVVEFDLPDGSQYSDYFETNKKYLVKAEIEFNYTTYDERLDTCSIYHTKKFAYDKYYQIEEGSNSYKAKVTFDYNLYQATCNEANPSVIEFFVYGIIQKSRKLGGGIRAQKISISDGVKVTNSVSYQYTQPNNSSVSSGVTTYAPSTMGYEQFIPYVRELPGPKVNYQYVSVIKNSHKPDAQTKTVYEFIVPKKSDYSANFEFSLQSNDPEVSEILKIENKQPIKDYLGEGSYSLNDLQTSDYIMYGRSSIEHNNSNIIGAVKKTELFNTYNDLMSSSEYTYSNQISHGYKNQTFVEGKVFRKWSNCPTHRCGLFFFLEECDDVCETAIDTFYITSFSKINYPINMVNQIDKSNDNIIYTYYEDFDAFNGNARMVRTVNGSNVIETYSLPAYEIDAYSNMSSKAIASTNVNMLSQNAATITTKNEKVINTSIITWKGDWNNYIEFNTSGTSNEFEYNGNDGDKQIWRKHKTFVWSGKPANDGTYGQDFYDGNFDNIDYLKQNWNTLFSGSEYGNWIKSSEVVRYDHFSTPVEVTDINGDFAATKKDANNVYTIASAANSSLTSFAATSFEDNKLLSGNYYHVGSNIIRNSYGSRISDSKAHTGGGCLELIPGIDACNYLAKATNVLKGQKYRVSLWVDKGNEDNVDINIKFDNVDQAFEKEVVGTFGLWTQLILDFDFPVNKSSFDVVVKGVNETCYIDDFRVSPYNAAVTAYTYDNAGNVTAILNNDNFATKYEYDAAGRLINTMVEKPEGFVRVSNYKYNFAEQFSVDPNYIEVPVEGLSHATIFLTTENPGWDLYNNSLPNWIHEIGRNSTRYLFSVDMANCGSDRSYQLIFNSVVNEKANVIIKQEPRSENSIMVKYPSENMKIKIDEAFNIIWYSCGAQDVKIELFTMTSKEDLGALEQVLVPATYSNSSGQLSMLYTIGCMYNDPINDCLPAGWRNRYYKIRISDVSDPAVYGESGIFKIIDNE